MSEPEMRIELISMPVSDIERAKSFYTKAGFAVNVDVEPMPGMRVIQCTPPGSSCSIVFGTGMKGGVSDMEPGSVKGTHLVVKDIKEARSALLERDITVGDIVDMGGVFFAEFSDPDGNSWLLQEFPPELRSPKQSFYEEK